jgi:hypothetical protein
MCVALYLFAESEGQPAQVVLRVEFIGLLVGCRKADEVLYIRCFYLFAESAGQ